MAITKLTDEQILKLIGERQKLKAEQYENSLILRTKLIDLQKKIEDMEKPYQEKIGRIEAGIKASILARGSADGLTSDTTIRYVSASERRGVDLDGLWDLKKSEPSLWKSIKKYTKITEVAARVEIRD